MIEYKDRMAIVGSIQLAIFIYIIGRHYGWAIIDVMAPCVSAFGGCFAIICALNSDN